MVTTLVSGIVIARTLGPAGRGLVTTLVAWPAVIAAVAGLSLYDGVLYYAARDASARPRLFANALWTSLALGAIAAPLGWLAWRRAVPLAPDEARVAAVGLALLPLWLWIDLSTSLLQARAAFGALAVGRVLAPAVATAAIVALRLDGALTPMRAVGAVWGGLAAQAAWQLARLWDDCSLAGDGALLRRCLGYAARVHVGTLAGLGGRRLDTLVLTAMTAPAIVGWYALAKTATEMLLHVSSATALALFPRVTAAADAGERARVARRAVAATAGVQIVGALGLALTAPWLVRLLWGETFAATLPLLWALLPAAVCIGVRATLSSALLAAGRPGWHTAAELATAAVALPLVLAGVHAGGALAVALAVSGAAAVGLAVALVGFARAFAVDGAARLGAAVGVSPRAAARRRGGGDAGADAARLLAVEPGRAQRRWRDDQCAARRQPDAAQELDRLRRRARGGGAGVGLRARAAACRARR